MTTRQRAGAIAVQPELPLGPTLRRPPGPARRRPAQPTRARATPRRAGRADEDRLDDHTRAIGRQGIAAARARLASAAGADPADPAGPQSATRVPGPSPAHRGSSGRAA